MEKTLYIFLAVVGFIVLYSLLVGFPIMWLWNWLMTDLFNLATIDFWQAVGLSLLCGFLFKSSNTNSSK